MKLLFATVLFCVSIGNATPSKTEPTTDKKEKTERKKEVDEKTSKNKNVHSLKKWKMTIEYVNGNTISKTIVVSKNSRLSALQTAFEEADKHLKNIKNVKDYSISPVTSSYVLLAGD
ncbi:putative membrane protein [Aquimarina sp. EL_43]|uniref:hypothetical protein n=1 Tax=Aquimarina TaxID=290174 RepID=UPI00046F42A4|nr:MULTISPECIES: hypothetical protein [Aquimarina]MBG6129636.1 putative membrane protein [Aquimarina sp. EL_35]MBG6150701.1 putative membrane protein [Aquimarina sp. EL_32]MBG6167992.1 putative membrane protein [Aquimarina sp. EL_43]